MSLEDTFGQCAYPGGVKEQPGRCLPSCGIALPAPIQTGGGGTANPFLAPVFGPQARPAMHHALYVGLYPGVAARGHTVDEEVVIAAQKVEMFGKSLVLVE